MSPQKLDVVLPDRVLVYARVKPASSGDSGEDELATSCDVEENVGTYEPALVKSLTVTNRMAACTSKSFSMDRVLGPQCTQKEVYEAVGAPVLDSVLQGCHGCVMAYGQTGSGKTHSMLNLPNGGTTDDAGIMPRLAVDLFTRIAADWANMYEIQIAMVQIYNESAMDLLVKSGDKHGSRSSPGYPANPPLKATQRKPADGGGWELSECTWIRCTSPEYLLECFRKGQKGLVYAETMMNKHSSRSHCVLQLRVNRVPRLDTAAVAEATGKVEIVQQRGLLTVVDMAGSERVKKSQSSGLRFNEATNINSSLLTFGNVVHALAKKDAHVNFRDSLLTKLLESSLSGLSRTSLLVCVAPEQKHAPETTTSLEFASRCMRLEAKPRVRSAAVEMDAATLARELAEGSTFSSMDILNQQVVSSQQQLDREKKESAAKEEKLADVIARERKERAHAEATTCEGIKMLEAEVSSLKSQLDSGKREALDKQLELTRAFEAIAAGKENCDAQLAKCEALEQELEAERKVSRDAVKRVEESAEDELRELLRRTKAEQATIQARLSTEIERERKSRNEMEGTLRAKLEHELRERMAKETEFQETMSRAKAEHEETEKQLRDALDRERTERATSEEQLQREIKERADTEAKLQLRVSELETELESLKSQLADAKEESLETDRKLSTARGDIAEVEDRFVAHGERINVLNSQLEEIRENARRAAEEATEAAAAKEAQVQELERKLHESLAAEQATKACADDQGEKVTSLTEQIKSLTSELEETREAARRAADDARESSDAEQRILRRVHELENKCQESVAVEQAARERADAADAARGTSEEELLHLREEWHEDLVELERASVTTSNEAEATARHRLASGISVTKRGRNGKEYRRMLRCDLETSTLEWATVGDFKNMSIKGAHMEWANDGSSFMVRGPKRDLEIEVTDKIVASWGRALHHRLPGATRTKPRQLTPLRLIVGKPEQPGGFRSELPDNFPMSPTSTAAATAGIAAKKQLELAHDAGLRRRSVI
jgi:hypothetical protein